MGKSKKVTEKVKLFYRGPAQKPSKVATDDDMIIILDSLKECLPLRNKLFVTNLKSVKLEQEQQQRTRLRLVVGLSASLRALKQRKTKAIIYDETAADHLSKYFIEFARLQTIPIIRARGLSEKATQFNLTTLLVVSIVSADPPSDISNEDEVPIESNEFDKLYGLLLESLSPARATEKLKEKSVEFKLPVLEKIPSSGKSKQKKQSRRDAIAAAKAANPQQTHVAKIKRVKMSKKVRHQGKKK